MFQREVLRRHTCTWPGRAGPGAAGALALCDSYNGKEQPVRCTLFPVLILLFYFNTPLLQEQSLTEQQRRDSRGDRSP